MADTNHKPGGSQDQAGELDRVLDAALAKYAAVEPRTGLEERVLAHLRAEPLPSRHAWWQWGLAGAVSAIAIVAILAWRSTRVSHPVIANHPPARIQQPSPQETNPVPDAATKVAVAKHAPLRRPAARRATVAAVAATPKLDQFPSPQPLSSEELALARYVQEFPEEAMRIAKTQAEYDLEMQKMKDAIAGTEPAGSVQER